MKFIKIYTIGLLCLLTNCRSAQLTLPADNTVTDVEGHIYGTVTIGSQVWMSENLRVTSYPDRSPIPYVYDNDMWANLDDDDTSDAFCFVSTNNHADVKVLYTYAAAIGDNWTKGKIDNQGICPDRWHLPSAEEWNTLKTYLSNAGFDKNSQGQALRATSGWRTRVGEPVGTDNFGFTTLPGDNRGAYSGTYNVFDTSVWWNCEEESKVKASICSIGNGESRISLSDRRKSEGCSVRCIKDTVSSKYPEVPTPTNINATYNVDKKTVTITWTPVPGDFKYQLYRCPVANGVYAAVGTQVKTAQTTDSNVSPTQNWHYKVSAVDNYYESIKSDYAVCIITDDVALTVTDIDGHVYGTTTIGNQIWMSSNLQVSRYPNGDSIPYIENNKIWAALPDHKTADAYCHNLNYMSKKYGPNFTYDTLHTYGYLYTYGAAIGDNWNKDNNEKQGICPDGWHLPSHAEWTSLETYLANNGKDGAALKTKSAWLRDGNGTDDFSFSALPGGHRPTSHDYEAFGFFASWWSSTECDFSPGSFWVRWLRSTNFSAMGIIPSNACSPNTGNSVRCLKNSNYVLRNK